MSPPYHKIQHPAERPGIDKHDDHVNKPGKEPSVKWTNGEVNFDVKARIQFYNQHADFLW